MKKETLKFEQDYDFEQANEQFQEVLNKLAGTKLEDGASTSKSEVTQENGDADGYFEILPMHLRKTKIIHQRQVQKKWRCSI